jgi:hypothetical protein
MACVPQIKGSQYSVGIGLMFIPVLSVILYLCHYSTHFIGCFTKLSRDGVPIDDVLIGTLIHWPF